MTAWAAEELKYADLGDMRRNKRLISLVSDLAAQPNVSVPQASGDWAATQAAYDFWQSPHVKAEAIRKTHQISTIERVKQHAVVIAIQDTTELSFTHHPSKKGMGYLDNPATCGLKVHSVLLARRVVCHWVYCTSRSGVETPLKLARNSNDTKNPLRTKKASVG